ncbi:S8 family serine peptidase [Kribbella sp. NBC_01505]|uniref:S8 family serine peptidase n=1 Tax=Kribbella sp. NBC_01505 TaxID=2903580 RepID=UPI00386720C1
MASIAALGIGMSGLTQASAARTRPETMARKAGQPGVSVTLLTGDRVTVSGDGGTTIEPGAGRRGIAFSSYDVKGHLYVVPSDIQEQFAGNRLDRRLFDVTGLIKAGYDDKSTKSIPVIVSYGSKAKTRAAAPGATVTRQLPAVSGAALSIDKSKAATFLKGAISARSATAIEKIWLDGKRQLLLDQSVPQIGAPEAWKAGFTGKGVKVAVLDSGVDATHPDLAPQVAGHKNFTSEPDGDLVGHGTHVASTIAGTGAASGGKYQGVAPDARLYDGKVCGVIECFDSSIVAGMEWAAREVKATVANISLGDTDTPELDPLEEAVNRLTAETGTLFVVAAGNSGPQGRSIDSPGSADAALTVGAVDKQDQLADFSSVGPRLGDSAIKPDVTAPGVDIVAARSKNGYMGTPVGDKYASMSGTSMATPHTVGAVAILAQEHPGWRAPELKAAIMGSARPAPGQSTYQQGAGRIDVAKGIKQTVVSDPGNLSFGTAVWPHDDDAPVTRTLTYRNLGDQPVTLNLAGTLTDPAGNAAPVDALQLSASTVTVPAGGTASVQVISNTKHNGPDGGYSGRVTATVGDASVVTGIGIDKEVESYNLTVRSTGPDGKPLPARAVVYGLDTDFFQAYSSAKDELTVRLPEGEYNLEAQQFIEDSSGGVHYDVVQPSLKLDADTDVDLDTRVAKPIQVTVPQAGATLVTGTAGYQRTPAGAAAGLKSSVTFADGVDLLTGQIGPALPVAELTGFVGGQWARRGADGDFHNSPYLYATNNSMPGVFPTGFTRVVRAAELAEVTQEINASSDRQVERVVYFRTGVAWAGMLTFDQPSSTKVFLEAGPNAWETQVAELAPDPASSVKDSLVRGPRRTYQAGQKYQERFNAAVFVPGPAYAGRFGNELGVVAYSLMDADGNKGVSSTDSESSRLLRDGEVIAESTLFGDAWATDLPAGRAKYTFQSSMTRQSYSAFSTRTELNWTFWSEASADDALLPMIGVSYRPKVDRFNVADRRPVTVLPIQLEAQDEDTLPVIKKVELQVSGDDGKTWHRATVASSGKASYRAIFATPKGARSISLKAHVVDTAGNTTDLTTIGAYRLR